MKKNDEIELNIISCTLEGNGIGKYDGLTVFVNGAVSGETVIAHIIKVKKNYAIGIIKKILIASEHRIIPACSISSKCGGCTFNHINYDYELEIKENQVRNNLLRIGHIDLKPQNIIPCVACERYRNKAQYPLSSINGQKTDIGFFAQRSHRVINCPDCLLQPEEFKIIIDVFREWISKFNISIFDEYTMTGLLRHIYIRKAFATGEIMVCAVINADELKNSEELIFELTSTLPEIKSIIININKENTNVILGEKFVTLWGQNSITDTLCGCKFSISPRSFYQVNHDTAEILYKKAKEYACVNKSTTLLDLYCGTGTIGITMAEDVKKLIGIELIPEAIENAKFNAKLNNLTNTEFICADASKAAQLLYGNNIKPDVVIVDPPRKGCSEALLGTLAKMSPERIVYVSCDSATLARDCSVLEALGYKLKEITPVDMFPRTGNVECVSLITKINNNLNNTY